MRRRKSWRDLPNLHEIYVTHLNSIQLFLPFHHHLSSCASRCATGTAPSWCCGEWEWERCRNKEMPCFHGKLVKPSKIAPGCGGETRKTTSNRDIWWNHRDPNGFFPILRKNLPRLFDHIWRLFLLPISRVIIFQCARVHTRGSQGEAKKRGRTEYSADISPDEGMDVWIYSHEYMMLYIITASLEWFFFPTLFPCHFAMAPAKRSVALLMEGSRGDM